jgi:hypothetical protein
MLRSGHARGLLIFQLLILAPEYYPRGEREEGVRGDHGHKDRAKCVLGAGRRRTGSR